MRKVLIVVAIAVMSVATIVTAQYYNSYRSNIQTQVHCRDCINCQGLGTTICVFCRGSGEYNGNYCYSCQGRGVIRCNQCGGRGQICRSY